METDVENVLSYKGYLGSMQISLEDDCLYGRLLGIDDLVTFEGSTVAETRHAFEESVDHYLRTCAEMGAEPDRPPQRREAAPGGEG